MRRFVVLAVVVGLTVSAVGCGGAAERGKNKDLDKPFAPATKKAG